MKTPITHALPWALLVTGMLAGACANSLATAVDLQVVEFEITGKLVGS